MRKLSIVALLAFVAMLGAIEPHFITDPAISPDGQTICFSYMGDLWSVPFDGGEAKHLTVNEASDHNPLWSPDGRWIAFTSNRDGRSNLWMIPAGGGPAEQINYEEMMIAGWYADSKHVLGIGRFGPQDIGYYKVDVNTGRTTQVAGYGDHYTDLARDGKSLIFAWRGDPYRERYQGSDAGELWRCNLDDESFEQLTFTQFTERYPVLSKQSDAVYYGASDGDNFQIFRVTGDDFAHPEQLTNFDTWSARDLSIAWDNDRLVFEYFDKLATWDPATGKVNVLDIEINQDFIGSFDHKEVLRSRFDAVDVSPNGKFIVFVAKYDLFAMPAEGGEVKQVTRTGAGIDDIAIMGDNRTIYFTMREDGVYKLFKTDITDFENYEKVSWSDTYYISWIYRNPLCDILSVFYDDGEDRSRAALIDSAGVHELTDRPWSAMEIDEQGEWILTGDSDQRVWNSELFLFNWRTGEQIDIVGGDDWIYGKYFGLDNRTAFFTRNGDIFRVDLAPKPVDYQQTDPWEEILAVADDEEEEDEEEGEDDAAAVEEGLIIVREEIGDRITKAVGRLGSNVVVHVASDSTFYYVNELEEVNTLRKCNYSGENDEEIATLGRHIDDFAFSEGANAFYYTQHGQLFKLSLASKRPEAVRYEVKYEWNELALNQKILRNVWVEFGKGFYDQHMHGLDWNKVWKQFSAYEDDLLTTEHLSCIVDEMIGDVNASHTGFYPRAGGGPQRYDLAQTGARFDWRDRPAKGVRVREVFSDAKLASPGGIEAGDILLSVDGVAITRDTAILPLFVDKIGEEIEMVFDTGESEPVTVKIEGLSYWSAHQLWYADWVARRRQLVDELSGGRIGYVHIEGMDNPSYENFLDKMFYDNLDKEAVIIDVRNNGGGRIHDRLFEVLTKKQYGYETRRGYQNEPIPTPGKKMDKPLALLCNQNSFSDAEIFPIIFKQMELGKVIGMPTPGGVIGTGHYNFMDGSSMRMPHNGWYRMDGVNMEGTGAAPDIVVPMSPEQIINDDDVQLQRAVEELLNDL